LRVGDPSRPGGDGWGGLALVSPWPCTRLPRRSSSRCRSGYPRPGLRAFRCRCRSAASRLGLPRRPRSASAHSLTRSLRSRLALLAARSALLCSSSSSCSCLLAVGQRRSVGRSVMRGSVGREVGGGREVVGRGSCVREVVGRAVSGRSAISQSAAWWPWPWRRWQRSPMALAAVQDSRAWARAAVVGCHVPWPRCRTHAILLAHEEAPAGC
jgi:hypothetical protein